MQPAPLVFGVVLAAAACSAADEPALDAEFFEAKIRPVLVDKCYKCHSADAKELKGGLRLDSRAGWQKGGDSGPAIVPKNVDDSLLIQALRYEDLKMPPDAKLGKQVIADFEEWIRRGAPDPRQGESPPPRPKRTIDWNAARQFWSFRPVQRPPRPTVRDVAWPKTIVDEFILARLEDKGLHPADPANRLVLLRRATFDLTGLPPAPEEIAAFLQDDSREAFAKVVERLLASPHYGAHWGRHWLDIVRYADTAGETADFPVPDAWRYRNYVIDAFNADKPYDQFLTEQLAGDILAAQDPSISTACYSELTTATGYLAVARRFGFDVEKDHFLTIDDTVDTLGKSVLGLAVGCARCHDHKYDPIPADDYYGLYGVFESTRYPFPGCEKTKAPRDLAALVPPAEWNRTIKPHEDKLAAMNAAIKKLSETQVQSAEKIRQLFAGSARVVARGEFDDGKSQAIAAEGGGVLEPVDLKPGETLALWLFPRGNHGADSTLVEWEIAETGGELRRWSLAADVAPDLLAGNPHGDSLGNSGVWRFRDGRDGVLLAQGVRQVDGKPGLDAWRKGDTPSVFANSTDQPITAWTTLPPKSVFAHPAPDGPVVITWTSPFDGAAAISGRVADAHPGGPDGVAWRLDHLPGDARPQFIAETLAASELAALERERGELVKNRPLVPVAYAVTEGAAHNSKIHLRGDPQSLGEEVPRHALQVLGGEPLTGSGSGRLPLARWLTSRDNPLTARVLVNRLWQHHFGVGLVATPNDFGTRGAAPTHPELLDELAARFMAEGWSIKAMHRLIMASAAYQAASVGAAECIAADPDNQWLGRFRRRRLTAEEIRDAILAASGDLDETPGGAHPFPDAKGWGFTQHAPFAAVYEHNRRSVYLMVQRIKRHPFLTLFDGADASASTPVRDTTTAPTQALYFLNDSFVHARSASLAGRLQKLPDDRARAEDACLRVWSRPAAAAEVAFASQFVADYAAALADVPPAERTLAAWSAWVRILFSANEFLYVD